jgi:hypothetical protein
MRQLLSLACALPCLAGSAFGWGCEGHQMIAMIARAHLTPAASAAVYKLLGENPIDPAQRRFCQNRPADLLAEGAPWADDMKPIDKTFLWHQIDIPLAISGRDSQPGDYVKWCDPIGPSVDGKDRPGCIVNAIPYELAILRDSNAAPADRAKALRYIVHLMGDLTQPLHVSDNYDQGGNCTRIKFFTMGALQTLHGIWDYDLLQHDIEQKKTTQADYAAAIDKDFSSHWREWGESRTDVVAWTWEGHDLAAPAIYAGLKPQLPLASPTAGLADKAACDAERNSVEAMHIFIGDDYAAHALPVIREQLAKAGYRLAGVLNQTFK